MIGSSFGNIQYFNPRKIGNLMVWLDATDPSANSVLPANGAAISSWVDKSTQGSTVVQATGANQPIFNTNQLNGHPGITFNGTTTFLNNTSRSVSGALTMIAVATVTDNAFHGIYAYLDGITVNTGASLFCDTPNNGAVCRMAFSGSSVFDITSALTFPATKIFVQIADGANQTFQINNTTIGSIATAGMNPCTNLNIGNLGLGVYPLLGKIYEVIGYSRGLTGAEIALVYNYLKNKWGF